MKPLLKRPKADKGRYYIFDYILMKNELQIGRRSIKGDLIFLFNLFSEWAPNRPKADKGRYYIFDFIMLKKTIGDGLVAFQSSVLPQEGGKVENGGTIFSLITYLINFIHVSNWADSQWAKILWWFLSDFIKIQEITLKKWYFGRWGTIFLQCERPKSGDQLFKDVYAGSRLCK